MMLDSKLTHSEGFYIDMIEVVQNQIRLQSRYAFHGAETSSAALFQDNPHNKYSGLTLSTV